MTLPPAPDLWKLVTLFSRSIDDIGQFTEVSGDQLPPHFRQLLDHSEHMVTMLEAAHASPVRVEVKRRKLNPAYYARKSLLRRQRGGEVLQFGIARLRSAFLDETVREDIESEEIPLGRILLRHPALQHVQRYALWQITTGRELQSAFGLNRPMVTYGRTAAIYRDQELAVEMLEILPPAEESSEEG